VQEYKNVDLATWYFWLKQAVETGLATVVKGKLPAKIDGTPRLDFIIGKPEPTATDKLTATLEKQAEAFNRLASAIEKLAAK
jgi:predicted YcjX-like family ATPase